MMKKEKKRNGFKSLNLEKLYLYAGVDSTLSKLFAWHNLI